MTTRLKITKIAFAILSCAALMMAGEAKAGGSGKGGGNVGATSAAKLTVKGVSGPVVRDHRGANDSNPRDHRGANDSNPQGGVTVTSRPRHHLPSCLLCSKVGDSSNRDHRR
jgi:hypothetical protein